MNPLINLVKAMIHFVLHESLYTKQFLVKIMSDICHVCRFYQTLQPLSFSTLPYKATRVNFCTTIVMY